MTDSQSPVRHGATMGTLLDMAGDERVGVEADLKSTKSCHFRAE